MARPTGLIVYRGKSKLDGKPIVAIATGLKRKSKNEKTGGQIQVWIFPEQGESPLMAAFKGHDASVCGSCPLKSFFDEKRGKQLLGGCYVNLGRAPSVIWKAYQRGLYEPLDRKVHGPLFAGRVIRLGAYGDPAAIPLDVWHWLCRKAKSWTGYTHQWRTCHDSYRRYCMASVETVAGKDEAQEKGWRTFRVIGEGGSPEEGEVWCPADKKRGAKKTCETCKACSGAKCSPRAASIVITAHGEPWRVQRLLKVISA